MNTEVFQIESYQVSTLEMIKQREASILMGVCMTCVSVRDEHNVQGERWLEEDGMR